MYEVTLNCQSEYDKIFLVGGMDPMNFSEYFPIFHQLTAAEQTLLQQSVVLRQIKKGTVIHRGEEDCLGLLLVCSGQLRAFLFSEEGRQITLYRLFERDICLFSASCMMKNIQFDLSIVAEKDTEAWLIPMDVYHTLMQQSIVVANYTNEIMGARFTEVMWLMEQIMWKSFDKRLAAFLAQECNIEGSDTLKITHEEIASHLGTAREVVSRMLKYFQNEGIVHLTRGSIEIVDHHKLNALQK